VVVPKKQASPEPVAPVPATAAPVAAKPVYVPSRPNNVYVGALFGVGVAGGGSSFTFGLDLGYKMSPEWGTGIYFTYLNLQSATTVTSTSGTSTQIVGASLVLLAGELNYFVPQVPEIHFGAKMGMGIASASALGTTATGAGGETVPGLSTFAFAGGITGGYDYPVTQQLSLGLEANFFYVTGDIASTVFNGLGAFKYTF
jgi:hypothetical protein